MLDSTKRPNLPKALPQSTRRREGRSWHWCNRFHRKRPRYCSPTLCKTISECKFQSYKNECFSQHKWYRLSISTSMREVDNYTKQPISINSINMINNVDFRLYYRLNVTQLVVLGGSIVWVCTLVQVQTVPLNFWCFVSFSFSSLLPLPTLLS
jgi:hypothetical protein